MAAKAKTHTKARARTKAPAVEPQPTPQAAAPQPVPAVVERVGLRTPSVWSPVDRNPRPLGDLTRLATLVRGNSYTISYSDGPLVFRYGVSVPITDVEFERLGAAIDRIDFQDPDKPACTVRSVRKFLMETLEGEAIEMPAIPDVEGGPHAMSAGDRAEFDRKFQGAEFTSR